MLRAKLCMPVLRLMVVPHPVQVAPEDFYFHPSGFRWREASESHLPCGVLRTRKGGGPVHA